MMRIGVLNSYAAIAAGTTPPDPIPTTRSVAGRGVLLKASPMVSNAMVGRGVTVATITGVGYYEFMPGHSISYKHE